MTSSRMETLAIPFPSGERWGPVCSFRRDQPTSQRWDDKGGTYQTGRGTQSHWRDRIHGGTAFLLAFDEHDWDMGEEKGNV